MSKIGFEGALKALKKGARVARDGWNGKNMFVYLAPSHSWAGEIQLEPFLVMRTADNNHVPWLASQTDLLAEDWCVLSGD